ncbi:hypothetical protein BFJ66_g11158 [Fusarium oxysporum f. sp. cepae]|uniref:Uncharacterized protein n=1 Tax=Fusarium oxysporum f. sp. cepae TaxID=396571 RepID=A0A3L6NK98_FUSOX|nr:hypothetical protein BFJ65_g8430 [Fusarium oxysporum f. sp. cepae]RKK39234.1 hypothetical protein BFJ67_g11538 [Fusarium oxysporum f. sp. cepae]RKK41128.1 hypothetical protein BFJ66_g11158 [Fusarium oxysporum f. sp. cepae]
MAAFILSRLHSISSLLLSINIEAGIGFEKIYNTATDNFASVP